MEIRGNMVKGFLFTGWRIEYFLIAHIIFMAVLLKYLFDDE